MTAFGRFLLYATGSYGSRLCENMLDAFKTKFCLDCQWNQQAEARIASSSNISPRNAVWATSAPKQPSTDDEAA